MLSRSIIKRVKIIGKKGQPPTELKKYRDFEKNRLQENRIFNDDWFHDGTRGFYEHQANFLKSRIRCMHFTSKR